MTHSHYFVYLYIVVLFGVYTSALINPSGTESTVIKGCRPQVDVIFLLDGSDSISDQEFLQQKEFLRRFVELSDVGPESVRVGLAVVSSKIGDELPLSLNATKASFLVALDDINQPQEGSRTDLGLIEMEQLFSTNSRRGVARIGVIITDGRAKYIKATEGEARVVKDAGIFLVAVGVGRLIKRYTRVHVHLHPCTRTCLISFSYHLNYEFWLCKCSFSELEKIASTTSNAYKLEPLDLSTRYLAETVDFLGLESCTGNMMIDKLGMMADKNSASLNAKSETNANNVVAPPASMSNSVAGPSNSLPKTVMDLPAAGLNNRATPTAALANKISPLSVSFPNNLMDLPSADLYNMMSLSSGLSNKVMSQPIALPNNILGMPASEQNNFIDPSIAINSNNVGDSSAIRSNVAPLSAAALSNNIVDPPGLLFSNKANQPGFSFSNMANHPGLLLSNMTDQPSPLLNNIANQPKSLLNNMANQPESLSNMASQPESLLSNMADQQGLLLSNMADQQSPLSSNMVNQPESLLSNMADQQGPLLNNMANQPESLLSNMASQPESLLSNMADQQGPLLNNMANQHESLLSNMASQPESLLSNMADQQGPLLSNMANQPRSLLSNMADQPGPLSSNMANQPGSLLSNMADQPGPLLGNMADQPGSLVSNMAEQPGLKFSSMVNLPGSLLGNIADQPGTLLGNMAETPGSLLSNMANQQVSLLNKMTDQQRLLLSKMGEFSAVGQNVLQPNSLISKPQPATDAVVHNTQAKSNQPTTELNNANVQNNKTPKLRNFLGLKMSPFASMGRFSAINAINPGFQSQLTNHPTEPSTESPVVITTHAPITTSSTTTQPIATAPQFVAQTAAPPNLLHNSLVQYQTNGSSPTETANLMIQNLLGGNNMPKNNIPSPGVEPQLFANTGMFNSAGVSIQIPETSAGHSLAFLKAEMKPTRTIEGITNPIYQMFEVNQSTRSPIKQTVEQMITTTMPTDQTNQHRDMTLLTAQCSNRHFVNGVAYVLKAGSCSEFVKCYQENGVINVKEVKCPFETIFDDQQFVCRHYTEQRCRNDPCADQRLASYHHTGNCRAYWQCIGGLSTPMCCPRGTSYTQGYGCVRNVTCSDTCMDFGDLRTVTMATQCKMLAIEGDKRGYFENVAGVGWVVRQCAPGTNFEQAQCSCSSTQKTSAEMCEPELYLDFQGGIVDKSKNSLSMGIQNVNLDGGTGAFYGQSHIKLWRFSGMSLGQHITISFRFRTSVTAKKGKLMHIVSNCCYGCSGEPKPSLDIALIPADNGGVAVFSTTSAEAGEMFLFLPFRDTFTGWNRLEFTYNGLVMTGTVNGLTASKKMMGNIEAKSDPLLIGSCGVQNAYDGFLDEFKFYMCNP